MVNNSHPRVTRSHPAATLVRLYAVVAIGTVVALAILSGVAPDQAPQEAWGHGVIVAVFAVLLLLRWRSARRGSRLAARAVRIISLVLLVANLVEAWLSVFPTWMRIEMGLTAALMLVISVALARRPLTPQYDDQPAATTAARVTS